MNRSYTSVVICATTLLCLLALSATEARADWKEVRALIRQGGQLSTARDQEKMYRQAYEMAQASVTARPNISNEHLWLANAAGRLALIASNSERVKLSKVVKDNAEEAIRLDPNNGPAYMTLGAWHFYVADLSWFQKNAARALYGGLPQASFRDAVTNLGKAISIGGAENLVEIYYLRGRAYEELDESQSASECYRSCLLHPARSPKEQEMQEDARTRL